MHALSLTIPRELHLDVLAALAISGETVAGFLRRALEPIKGPEAALLGVARASSRDGDVEYRVYIDDPDLVNAAWEIARAHSVLSFQVRAGDVFACAIQRAAVDLLRSFEAQASELAAVRRHQAHLVATHGGHSAPRHIDEETRADLKAWNGLFEGLENPAAVLHVPPSPEELMRRETLANQQGPPPASRSSYDEGIERGIREDTERSRRLIRGRAVRPV